MNVHFEDGMSFALLNRFPLRDALDLALGSPEPIILGNLLAGSSEHYANRVNAWFRIAKSPAAASFMPQKVNAQPLDHFEGGVRFVLSNYEVGNFVSDPTLVSVDPQTWWQKRSLVKGSDAPCTFEGYVEYVLVHGRRHFKQRQPFPE